MYLSSSLKVYLEQSTSDISEKKQDYKKYYIYIEQQLYCSIKALPGRKGLHYVFRHFWFFIVSGSHKNNQKKTDTSLTYYIHISHKFIFSKIPWYLYTIYFI